jgi:hypothetical protein
MADNVAITAGAGTTVATDDVTDAGGAHYQKIKIADGTANSTAMIGGDATNGLDVDVTRVKPDGTNIMPSGDAAARALFVKQTDGSLTAGIVDETGASAVDAQAVGGGTPHDAVDSGNPIKVGHVTIAHGTNPTQVAAADRSNWYSNRHGIPFMIGGHPNIVSAEYYTTAVTTDDNIMPAIASGTKYVITSVSVMASAANSVNTSVRLCFGTSIVAQGASQADATTKVILSHPGIAPGSGVIKGNGAGIVGVGGDGEELRIANSVPTGGSITVQVDYFTIES